MFLSLRTLSILLLITCLFVTTTPSQSGDLTLPISTSFTSSDVTSGDIIGASIAVSGDTVVVGSFHDSDSLPSSGSAYVFVRDGENWVQQQKLLPTAPIVDMNFGRAISISGDTIVIGAGKESMELGGTAYVFVRSGSTWSLQQKLFLPDGRFGDGFGAVVGISGDTIAVGMPNEFDESSLPGSVAIFVRDANGVWSMQQKVRPHDLVPHALFADSIAISGDTVIVSAQFLPTNPGRFVGAVYVFERVDGIWSERQKLQVSNSRAGADFGRAMAIDGDTIVLGAQWELHGTNTQGSAYVYVRDGDRWSQQQKLFARDSEVVERFGMSVAIKGDRIVVGNIFENEQRGSAYVFERDEKSNWSQRVKLIAADGEVSDVFGVGAATNGSTVLVGAPGKAGSSGAVYFTVIP